NITNISSNINSDGNIDIVTTGVAASGDGGNINIVGSNISALGNGSLTAEFGNVNIINAVDSKMTEETRFKSGSFHSRYDSVYDYKETAVESKLNFGGDLAVNAELGTMNLIGSTLKTGGDLNIGSFTVAQNIDGQGNITYKTNADGTFQTIDGGSVAGVNIKAAELRSEHREVHEKSKLTLGDTLKTLANPVDMAKFYLDSFSFLVTPSFKKDVLEFKNGPKYERSSAKNNTATITQHSATLDVGGNMMMNSTGDVNIIASNVDISGNALMNVDGNVNVLSAAEKTTSSNKTEEIEIGTIKLTRDLAHASASVSIEGTGSTFEDSLTTTTQKSSNINIGGSILANVTNNLNSLDSGNMTLAASNLTVGGDSIIKTAGNFNLTDAKETSSHSTKESTLTVEAGLKVGNAYVDAGYAWKAVADAQNKAIKAAEKLKKMERLQDEGKATAKAVELAAAQLILAQTAVATATIAASAATASAASTSFGMGIYGAGYLNTTSTGIKNTTETSLSKASNFTSYGDIDIASNNNVNVLGSMLASRNGNVSLAAANDIKIEAGTNTLSRNSKQETIYGGGSVGNNGYQANIGLLGGSSSCTSASVQNDGGSLNISGANLLAKNLALNIGNNLNISSKQTEEDYSSSGFGFNFGGGAGAGGKGGNIGGGFNISNADKWRSEASNLQLVQSGINITNEYMHKLWVDNITTIKGTDSMNVNVEKDLNLTGAAILSDNLALAVKGNINKKELQDSYYSESMGIGFSQNLTTNGNQPTIPGTGGKPNQAPGGSTSINANYSQNESSRSVYATIGSLSATMLDDSDPNKLRLTSATKDVTGGDFEGSLTLDHRLFSESGRKDIGRQLNYSKDLAVTPFAAFEASRNSKENNKTEKFFQAVSGATIANTRLLLNQDITAQQLAGDTNLIAYEGDSLSADSKARDRNAFYDSNTDTAALNSSYTATQSDKVVAGKIAHEAIGHKVGGESEFVAGFVENTVKNNWSDYQSGNINFQLTLPQSNIYNNNYASGVSFA
ncbi:hypothetical protein EB001_19440, partial [bacterium]|nr:hypothetical protein [bacterium]